MDAIHRHAESEPRICLAIGLQGDVQGCGIRPAIANLAVQLGLAGTVRNSRQGVEVKVAGHTLALTRFRRRLKLRYPLATQTWEVAVEDGLPHDFQILPSAAEGAARFTVPLDRVVCKVCLDECLSPGDRRYGYALNSCAQCGPRYSIIAKMPYDRDQTSMSAFRMCNACRSEYITPTHRRFHAQNNCCPDCGPKIWFERRTARRIEGDFALEAAAQVLLNGQILALKGLGGYQLICDATDEAAVSRLRDRKHRLAKPLAVMVSSVAKARELAMIDGLEQASLESTAGPIVILRARQGGALCPQVHPGLTQIGLMLPTTALHALLLRQVDRPLVVTSGNREGEPLEYETEGAQLRLAGVADGWLQHERPILRPIDDSVVRCMAGRQVTLRAARGLAPLLLVNGCSAIEAPQAANTEGQNIARHLSHREKSGGSSKTNVWFSNRAPALVGLGGQQKSAIAVSNDRSVNLGPHIGDLNSVLSQERFLQQQAAFQSLLECTPAAIAHDRHPDFFSSRLATEQFPTSHVPVQHHHAHVVAGMFEHAWLDREVLGIAFDGTGLGGDGTIWGGELLVCRVDQCKRVEHLRPFQLAGGELAIQQPWRVSVALLRDALGAHEAFKFCKRNLCRTWQVPIPQLERVLGVLRAESLSIQTTSMGRLFEGIAAIVLGCGHSNYEGEAAMRLESRCDDDQWPGSYAFDRSSGVPVHWDWRPLIRAIAYDLSRGLDPACMAMKFHRSVAHAVAETASRYPHLPLVLTGGVFQNRRLLELINGRLANRPQALGLPGKIPPNDAGLAVGQVAVAASRFARQPTCV